MFTNPGGRNDLTSMVIGAAIEVHKECGPGLLESVYTECLAYELADRGLEVERGTAIPLTYRGRSLSTRFYLDLRVNRAVIVEVKSVSALAPVHTAQVLTYLKLTNCHVGLLINFNVPLLKDGIARVIRPLRTAGAGVGDVNKRRNGGTKEAERGS